MAVPAPEGFGPGSPFGRGLCALVIHLHVTQAISFGRPARLLAEVSCGASAIATFAAGLETDGAAVRAAVTRPWSSGQAEGRINRIKPPERQSYGRASFDLPRRRVPMAA